MEFFNGRLHPFSRCYPCIFYIDNVMYNCVDQYHAAEKARYFKDTTCLELIMQEQDTEKMQRWSRKINGGKQFASSFDWYKCLLKANMAKFGENSSPPSFIRIARKASC